jgi:hypothetical protein
MTLFKEGKEDKEGRDENRKSNANKQQTTICDIIPTHKTSITRSINHLFNQSFM